MCWCSIRVSAWLPLMYFSSAFDEAVLGSMIHSLDSLKRSIWCIVNDRNPLIASVLCVSNIEYDPIQPSWLSGIVSRFDSR